VGGQRHAPAALPPGKTRYLLYRRLGGPRGRSGRVRKISPPPGLDPRIVQPVASRYTDRAIPAHTTLYLREVNSSYIYIIVLNVETDTINSENTFTCLMLCTISWGRDCDFCGCEAY